MNRIHDRWSANLAVAAALTVIVIAAGCSTSSLKELSFFRDGSAETEKAKSKQDIAEEISAAFHGHDSATLAIWHESFEDAQDAAMRSGKPILADFTGGDWCHWCIKLEEDVFEKEKFKQWAKENVTLLELNFPRQSSAVKSQNKALARQYKVTGYPTVLLLTPEGEVLGKLGYGADVNKWVQSADDILSR